MYLTVSSVSSDSIVKGIIVNTAVKTAKVDEQKTNIYNILLINMTQSCQIKQRALLRLVARLFMFLRSFSTNNVFPKLLSF
jgi:hypothetical protein